MDIVVTGGGTLTSSANSSLVINGNSDIYVLEGGNANFSNDFLYFSNGGSLYVYGNMTATFLQVNSGNFYVGPTGYASVGTLISQGSGTILNEGTLIVAEDGWDEGETDIPVHEYNVTYVPGVNLYVLEDTNPFEIAFRVTDNQGFGATVNTEDFNSVRLTLPEGTYFYPEDLPYTLVFDPELDGTVFATIRVTLN